MKLGGGYRRKSRHRRQSTEIKVATIRTVPAPARCDPDHIPAPRDVSGFLQKSTLRALRSQQLFTLDRFDYEFRAVKPESDELPNYAVDEAITSAKKQSVRRSTGECSDDVKGGIQELNDHGTRPLDLNSDDKPTDFRAACAGATRALEGDGIFWRYNPRYEYRPRAISRSPNIPMWSPSPTVRLLIQPKALEFKAGGFEPMFCSLCVYDMRRGVRATETFEFSFNDPEVFQRLIEHEMTASRHVHDAATVDSKHESVLREPPPRSCIFSLSEHHRDMYLVLRVERVLQGDTSASDSLYLRGTRRPATTRVIRKKTLQTIGRLREYRQPFCWSMLRLFEDKDGLTRKGFDKMYFQLDALSDQDFVALARDVATDQKRLPVVQGGRLRATVTQIAPSDGAPSPRVTPSGTVHGTQLSSPSSKVSSQSSIRSGEPSTISDGDNRGSAPTSVVQELQEFTRGRVRATVPHTAFTHSLFVHVDKCNFHKHRNILVAVEAREADGSLSSGAVEWIWDAAVQRWGARCKLLPVSYHNKKPGFYSEVKVRLPLQPRRQSHIFFTFYNVSCKRKAGLKRSTKDIIGYSVLPICPNGTLLSDGEHTLRVADRLPKNYLIPFAQAGTGARASHARFRFGGELRFSVRTRGTSCLLSADRGLSEFISAWPTRKEIQGLQDGKKDALVEVLLRNAVQGLGRAEPQELVLALHGLLGFLTDAIRTWQSADAQFYAFIGLIIVSHKVNEHFDKREGETCDLLLSYARHVYCDSGLDSDRPDLRHRESCLHRPLAECWLRALDAKDQAPGALPHPADQAVLKCGSFLFELLFKSLVCGSVLTRRRKRQDSDTMTAEEHGHTRSHTTEIKNKIDTHRTSRPASVAVGPDTMARIVDKFVEILHSHRSLGRLLLRNVVHAFGRYLAGALGVLSSSHIVELAERFVSEKDGAHDAVRVDLRADFLDILFVDNDHIVDALLTDEPSLDARGSERFHCRSSDDIVVTQGTGILVAHPLVRCLVSFIRHNIGVRERTVQEKVVGVLQSLLTKIDYDARYQAARVRVAVATVFLPLLQVLVESVADFERLATSASNRRHLRNTLACALWVLKGADPETLAKWWRSTDTTVLVGLLRLLSLAVVLFEYVGAARRRVEERLDVILDANTASEFGDNQTDTVSGLKSDMETLYAMKQDRKKTLTLRQRRARIAGLRHKAASWRRNQSRSLSLADADAGRMRSLLRFEAGMNQVAARTILHTVAILLDGCPQHVDPRQRGALGVCGALFALLSRFLSTNQIPELWTSSLSLVTRFAQAYGPQSFLTEALHSQLFGLVAAVLSLGRTASESGARPAAARALHALLWANFAAFGNVNHVQVAMTLSLAKLVPSLPRAQVSRVEGFLRMLRSANASVSHGKRESNAHPPAFQQGFKMLMDRLHTILRDSVEISRLERCGRLGDPTSLEQLLWRLSRAFAHLPEVRAEHLKRLAQLHSARGAHAEAGQCYVAVAEIHAGRLDDDRSRGFGSASPAADAEGQMLRYYEMACDSLYRARLYEQCYSINKKVLPFLEAQGQWRRLASAHATASRALAALADSEAKGDRRLGTYYRVGFYGRVFGPARNGLQFLYKEPLVTRLVEVVSRLKKSYAEQTGADVLVVGAGSPGGAGAAGYDSKNVITVAFVRPYFESEEAKTRKCFIDLNTSLSSFVFSTPFTAKGKAQGDITGQCKLKTILNVADPFPCCRTAQRVVSSREVTLGPIASAIEDLDARSERIDALLGATSPVSYKALEGVLQGSVATQVHGGAVEIARAFLGNLDEKMTVNERAGRVGAGEGGGEDTAELKEALRRFLRACERGLDASQKLVSERRSAAAAAAAAADSGGARKGDATRVATTASTSPAGVLAAGATGEVNTFGTIDAYQAHLMRGYDEMCSIIRPLIRKTRKTVRIAERGPHIRAKPPSL